MKLIGAAFVLVAGILVAYTSLSEEKDRLITMKELSNALDIIHGELSARQSSLFDIACCVEKHTTGRVSAFFGCVQASLTDLGIKCFSEIWRETAEKYLCLIDDECLRDLLHLGDILGRYELSEQLSALMALKNGLSKVLDGAGESYAATRKLRLYLAGAISSLLIIVLL